MRYTVETRFEPNPPEWITFEGEHFPIMNEALGFIMRAFRLMGKQEQAMREMYPYLKSEKNAYLARIEKERAQVSAKYSRSTITALRGNH